LGKIKTIGKVDLFFDYISLLQKRYQVLYGWLGTMSL